MNSIFSLISVASSRDLELWTLSHPRILQFIEAQNYAVVVPPGEVAAFRAATDERFQVLSEETFLDGFSKSSIEEKLKPALKFRAGWYLQQFVKVNALGGGPENSVNLIWDADTIPFRKLDFFEDGKVQLYSGTVHHEPYFQTIEDLLGLSKKVDHSFIAQCFPARNSWVKSMCEDIEQRAKTSWIEAVLAAIPQENRSEFSEYETIGTYISNRFPDEFIVRHRTWERFGYSVYGNPGLFTDKKIKRIGKRVDFASFEPFDKNKDFLSKAKRKIKSKVRHSLMKGPLRTLAARIRGAQ